jgi:hypothetical protein
LGSHGTGNPAAPAMQTFERIYSEKFEKKYGYFRPVIGEVVHAYMRCGDLKDGFARVRCPKCAHEYLLQLICYSYYTSFDLHVSFQFLVVKFFSGECSNNF